MADYIYNFADSPKPKQHISRLLVLIAILVIVIILIVAGSLIASYYSNMVTVPAPTNFTNEQRQQLFNKPVEVPINNATATQAERKVMYTAPTAAPVNNSDLTSEQRRSLWNKPTN